MIPICEHCHIRPTQRMVMTPTAHVRLRICKCDRLVCSRCLTMLPPEAVACTGCGQMLPVWSVPRE